MFKYFDIYDKGSVSLQDFVKAMEKIGLYYSIQEMEPLFRLYDSDRSGSLDYKEFSAIVFADESQGLKGQQMKRQPVANSPQAKQLVDIFRKKVLQRGARGIIGLQRVFKNIDDDGSKSLSLQEFQKAVREFKAEVAQEDVGTLFSAFDINRDGTIQYDEFLRIIRGDLNDYRRSLVERAFKKLDRDGSGVVEVQDLVGVYNGKKHPAVIEGRKTEEQVLGEFLETFETHHNIMNENERDFRVTLDEFIEYYSNVSASIDDDMYFQAMMNSAWNLSGDAAQYQQYGKSWANEDSNATRRPQTGQPKGGSYQRKNDDPTGQATIRSGMVSSDFTLGNTQAQYYQKQGSPQRQSLGNLKHISEGQRDYKIITGQESGNNPFVSNINSQYGNHISNTQQKIQHPKPLATMAQQKQNEYNLGRFKEKIFKRGVKGLIGLKRQFKIMDSDESGALDFQEFKKALEDYKVGCNQEETEQIFGIFDTNKDGTINFEEFMDALLGTLSEYRTHLVKQAYQKLDENGNGILEVDEVKFKFDPSRHPDVTNGSKTAEECRYEFFDLFSTHHNVSQSFKPDKSVSLDEFLQYHQFVSSVIDNDNLFKIFMSGVWNMDLVDTNAGLIKTAGQTPAVYGKTSKEQWKYDMHRSLFGEQDNTPMKHEVNQVYQKKQAGRQQVNSAMPVAGQQNWNQVGKAGGVQASQDMSTTQKFGQSNQPNFQQAPTEKTLLNSVREKIISRGARGINGIKRVFKIMDDNESKTLDRQEFTKAMRDYRITQDQDEVNTIFKIFDRDGNGEINYDEFLRTIVGKMNDRRRNMVTLAFKKFDADGNGCINIEDLKGRYNAKMHPDVKMGKKSEEDVLYEFLDTFEQHYSLSNPGARDRTITLAEFIEYYNNISCSIDNDEYFEIMIRNAWNLDNKSYAKGWGAEQ
eukprot:403347883